MSQFIADLHIHSKFSMATSKKSTPDWLHFWARAKGIGLIGTGDFTHPLWIDLLQEQLVEAETGLYALKPEFVHSADWVSNENPRFMLTAEISTIYKKAGKTRKVHTVFWAPSFKIVQKIQKEFDARGYNIRSDGRPIIGLDVVDLVEMCLNISEDVVCVPAHIWTPWFSALGAKSGFDSIEECYGDMAPHIFAVETGLSSDAPMNFMCSKLDKYALLSNSDAHSPEKIGRNANLFHCDMDYYAIVNALKQRDGKSFIGTIDMYPQEGKYHFSGHRKCNVCLSPLEVLEHNFMCTVCNKPITLGVMDRVAQLSDRDDITPCESLQKTQYLIPLVEILSEMYGFGTTSKRVVNEYQNSVRLGKNEIYFLSEKPIDEIAQDCSPMLAEGIRRMRQGNVFLSPGFDGEYGSVRVFTETETQLFKQNPLYVPNVLPEQKRERFNFDLALYHEKAKTIDFSCISGKKADTQLRLF